MGAGPAPAPWLNSAAREKMAREKMAEVAAMRDGLGRSLPTNRALLQKIAQYGLQKV
jgi:hypothetical protein